MSSPRINTSAVLPASRFLNAIDFLVGAGLLLDPADANIHLLASNLPITPATDLVTLVAAEAVYAGYAPVAFPAVSGSYFGEDGRGEIDASAVASWTGPVGGGGPTIYGFFVTNLANSLLIYSGKLSSPYPLVDDGTRLHFLPSVYFPFNAST